MTNAPLKVTSNYVPSTFQPVTNENKALTPRSGLDSGMTFSFSSFGDDRAKKNRHPSKSRFQQKLNKLQSTAGPTENTLFFHPTKSILIAENTPGDRNSGIYHFYKLV